MWPSGVITSLYESGDNVEMTNFQRRALSAYGCQFSQCQSHGLTSADEREVSLSSPQVGPLQLASAVRK